MKCHILFSGKNKKNFKMLSAENFTQSAKLNDAKLIKYTLYRI